MWSGAHGAPEAIEGELEEHYATRPARPIAQMATRIGLWIAIGIGCLGGAIGLVRPPATEAQPIIQVAGDDTIVPSPVAGVAELVVEDWLTASGEDIEHLRPLFVDAPAIEGRSDTLDVLRVSTVAGKRLADGYWSVTVAAEVVETIVAADEETEAEQQTSTWYVEVGIVGDAGTRLAALTTPAVVPPPSGGLEGWQASAAEAAEAAPDSPLAVMATGFLNAVLAEAGDPNRYTAPGLVLEPLSPSPFLDIVVTEIAADELEGGSIRVLAYARATTRGGASRDVAYEMIARERDGRWEVAQFSGAPTLVVPPPPPEDTAEPGTGPGASPTSPTSASPSTGNTGDTTADATTNADPAATGAHG